MKDRYVVIDELKHKQTVKELCGYLGVHRSGYYAYLKRKEKDPDQELKRKIKAIYEQRDKTVGYRRIQDELYRQYHLVVNHKKVLRLMQELRIKAIIRRKYVHRTTYEAAVSDGRVAENLLKRNFKADKPNQKWVTDVTQYRVFDEKIYLSAIKDLWNNEIVGYHISRCNDNPLVLETFRKAFETHKDVTGLIVHSDQGCQYTSHAYHDMLPQVGAQISMSRRGNCYDNASIESFFSHLKVEALYPYDIRSIAEAQRRIEEYIRFYNEDRAQRKLNKLTPVEYRNQLVA
ncbi:IS3 family transposase [Paenibacillus sp. FSL H7-0716]|uniref:IS3 family transposase n=1 Tax=Paenibacillus tianjinensis TaxID=2810347 RepID=A0ABX7L7D4_9BACL|nr:MULTISPECIES: IS3 family transposase [Paenibacillus]QSF42583.1 IS3 family transposase [Paenibacillus tianjinensis]QSF43220.1 IS3 family transposase [Paenibacillus tianjinensis]QSF45406.1 IS3 family transposase [Paenibacillus tianjinensis]QSF46334.1 IS3 family transposase [Paenibacillus tianjinensis]QSF47523.1 IS3 family transposase [Paenibacillus tianjinensis]